MPTPDQVRNLISEITGLSIDIIGDEKELKADLQMDSIAIVDLISSLEEDFDLIVEQEAMMGIKTVGELLNKIKEL